MIEIKNVPTYVCGEDDSNNERIPGIPSSRANEISLQITATLDDFISEVVELLMPPSFLQLANNELALKT